jgi:hypothetical protein
MAKYYHSTTDDRIKSILEKGLDPSFAGTGADSGVPKNIPGYKRMVFLTQRPSIHKYGPAMFEVDLPNDFPIKPLYTPPFDWLDFSKTFTTEQAIPPNYIKLLSDLVKAQQSNAVKLAASLGVAAARAKG